MIYYIRLIVKCFHVDMWSPKRDLQFVLQIISFINFSLVAEIRKYIGNYHTDAYNKSNVWKEIGSAYQNAKLIC